MSDERDASPLEVLEQRGTKVRGASSADERLRASREACDAPARGASATSRHAHLVCALGIDTRTRDGDVPFEGSEPTSDADPLL